MNGWLVYDREGNVERRHSACRKQRVYCGYSKLSKFVFCSGSYVWGE